MPINDLLFGDYFGSMFKQAIGGSYTYDLNGEKGWQGSFKDGYGVLSQFINPEAANALNNELIKKMNPNLKVFNMGDINMPTESDKAAAASAYGLMAIGDIEKQYAAQRAFDPLSDINIAANTNTGSQGNFAKGGITTKPGFVPYQTENEEVLILPDLSIIDTAATKKHGKMRKDQVTDYIPQNTYIGSARVKIKKKDADKIVIATTSVNYKEGEKPKEPKQYTLGDLFTKPTMSVADIIRRVAKKYPVIDKPGDAMVGQANDLNKMQRIPYLQAIVGLAESQKSGKETDNNGVPIGKLGGIVTQENVPKAGGGLFAVGSLVHSLGTLWNMKQIEKTGKEVKADTIAAYKKSSDLINSGAAIGVGAILGQDPTVTPTDYSSALSEIQSMPGEVPYTVTRGINESGDGELRGITNEIFNNSSNFGEAINSIAKIKAGQVGEKNKSMLKIAELNASIAANKTRALATIKEKIAKTNSEAANQTKGNRNKQLSSIGNLGVGTANSLSTLELSKQNALNAIKMQLAQNKAKAVDSITGDFSNFMASTENDAMSMMSLGIGGGSGGSGVAGNVSGDVGKVLMQNIFPTDVAGNRTQLNPIQLKALSDAGFSEEEILKLFGSK